MEFPIAGRKGCITSTTGHPTISDRIRPDPNCYLLAEQRMEEYLQNPQASLEKT